MEYEVAEGTNGPARTPNDGSEPTGADRHLPLRAQDRFEGRGDACAHEGRAAKGNAGSGRRVAAGGEKFTRPIPAAA